MKDHEVREYLRQTLEDHRLARQERDTLRELLLLMLSAVVTERTLLNCVALA